MRETIRFYRRLCLLALWTICFYLPIMCSRPLRRYFPGAQLAFRHWVLTRWSSGVARIVGLRIRVHGEPPRGPFLMVSNHLSDLDIIVYASLTAVAFVSRADLASWAIAGPLAKVGDTIFIERERLRDTVKVNQEILATIEQGIPVHVFAEGGISRDGAVHPFKPPLLQCAIRGNVPVYYSSISYETPEDVPPPSESIIWHRDVSFRDHVFNLLRLRAYTAVVTFGADPVQGTDRKSLAEELTARVRAIYSPVV